jgi:hypothetical protein
MTVLNFFECLECGFDSDEAKWLSSWNDGICPLCAGDTGKDVYLKYRPATEAEIARLMGNEGKQ